MEQCYIYKIDTEDAVYIGSTMNVENRQDWHNRYLYQSRHNTKLYTHCREKGVCKIELVVLESVPVNERQDAEQHYIDWYKDNGYNLLNSTNAKSKIRKKK